MSKHLRYAGASANEQQEALQEIIRSNPVLLDILQRLRVLGLPDWLLASGAIYNTVWNRLTDRPSLTGIKDADAVYFDASDLSYEAEDRVIQRARPIFADLPIPVELRNQARVHLWFPHKFRVAYPQLRSSAEMMNYFASKTHAVAVRLERDDELTIIAPFGLDDLFSFRIVPNLAINNQETHTVKALRAKTIWPEIQIVPWPDQDPV